MRNENECQHNYKTYQAYEHDIYWLQYSVLIRASSGFASSIFAKEKVTTSKEEELRFWGQGYFQRTKNVALLGHRALFLVLRFLGLVCGIGVTKEVNVKVYNQIFSFY